MLGLTAKAGITTETTEKPKPEETKTEEKIEKKD